MGNKINSLYEFGEFRLDTKERVLIHENETIILAPKVFDTLEVLIKSDGKIVSKDDLMSEIWADSFVEEGNLTQNIYVLRQTLGKDFIETIPRRGYRFSADVNVVELEKVSEKNKNNFGQNFENDKNLSEVIVATKTKTYLSEEIIEDSLEPIRAETLQSSLPANKRSNGLFIGLAIGVLAVSAISAIAFWNWNNSKTNTLESSSNRLKFLAATDTGNVLNSAISPNGNFLALVKKEKNLDNSLWLKDVKLKQEVRLEFPENLNATFVSFSENGENIYIYSRPGSNQAGEIHIIDRFGGNLRLIAKDVWSAFGLSGGDKFLSFIRVSPATNDSQLIVKNLETDEEKILATKQFPEEFSTVFSYPVFSSNDKSILAVSEKSRKFTSNLLEVDVETGTTKKIEIADLKEISQVAYKNEDEIILIAQEEKKSPQIYKLFISSGKLEQITDGVDPYVRFSLAKNGQTLSAIKSKLFSNLWFIPDADTKKAKQITFGNGKIDGIYGLNTLPDGEIIYVSVADKQRDFWTADPETGELRQLTKNEGKINEHPFVSRKNRYIYFDSLRDGNRNVYRMDFDGQNVSKITSDENAIDLFPVASNDETQLYFVRQAKGVSAIWKKDLPDGKPEKLEISEKAIPVGFLKISPDGKFLMFRQGIKNKSESPAKTYQVGIIPIENLSDDPKFVEIPSGNLVVRWSQKSDAVDYFAQTDSSVEIWRKNIFKPENKEKVAELPNMRIFNFSWFSNGKDLVVSEGKFMDDVVLIQNF
jgi:DNA-binding winged helix-turn-helix (wHTH) protein/Tol biopolymer transport system component